MQLTSVSGCTLKIQESWDPTTLPLEKDISVGAQIQLYYLVGEITSSL